MKATFDKWFTAVGQRQDRRADAGAATAGLNAAMPAPASPGGGRTPGRGAAQTADAQSRARAGDDGGAARPRLRPSQNSRARCSSSARPAGFVHSSIPLAGRTIEEMGKKTGAWSTTITYDPADINEANLKQYDAIFLASTTGAFLDDPNDAAATAARRKALLDFVRGGKGLAGIHAATDSYHQNRPSADAPAGGGARRPGGGGRGGGRGGAGVAVAAQFVAQGDKNGDQKISREEFAALADAWYTKLDTGNTGRVSQADFPQRFAALMPAPPAARARPHRSAEWPGARHQPRTGQPGRHVARVQHDDRRLLQVPLERRPGHHVQGGRSEPSAERRCSRESRSSSSSTKPTPWAATLTRARICASSPASTTRR